ncbi:MAG: DUF1570 domain-containing protein [Planctomycetaceae bacterium]
MPFIIGALLAGAASAGEKWITVGHSGPFTLKADYSHDEHAALLEELSSLQQDLAATLQLKIEEKPIQIFLFRQRSNYLRYLSQRIPEGTSRQALFVKGDKFSQVYAYSHGGYDTDIRHEGTHAVLHNSLPYVPLWLDEGLAEYFEETAANRASDHPHWKSLRWSMRFGWKPDLKALEKKSDLTEFDGKDYRDSWAVVHYLLHGGDQAEQALVDYLAEIQSDRPPGKMSEFLTARIPDFDRELLEHLGSWK